MILSSLEIVEKDERKITVKLKDVPLQYANALRRVCLNGVPVFAIDTVDIIENTSVLPDEGLAHRLGLVPLRTDLGRFGEESESYRVMLVLDFAGSNTESATVLSASLRSEDSTVVPTSDKIPIVDLAPGQTIKAECFARLGRGTEHAKWNSSNVSILADGDVEGERILTIESTGALKPEQILLAGIDEVCGRLEGFGKMIGDLK